MSDERRVRSNDRRVRSDEHGLYVLTGGYVFRPAAVAAQHFPGTGPRKVLDDLLAIPEKPHYAQFRETSIAELGPIADAVDQAALTPSKHAAGDLVAAHHIPYTQTARVGGELWVSADTDPRYTHRDPITGGTS